jgi:hypothetical protein
VIWLAGVLVTLALATAALYVSLPERALALDDRTWQRRLPVTVVRGAYHVHTRRSDGSGSLDDVAAAAGRAGLDFVIVTDHGDGTRPPEAPTYRFGVLLVDAVEISTTGGHYVALGLPPAPYPLAGEPRDVVEDVRRMGGMGIVAHPDSAKRSLAWRDWNLDVDGFEWLNADSEWRDESRRELLTTLLHYPWRAPESVVALFDRPEAALRRWDEAAGEGTRWVALAGLDAHARFGWRGLPDEEDDRGAGSDDGFSLAVPSYESMFRSMTASVELDQPMTGDARTDAAALLAAVRRGRVCTVLDGLARGGRLEFFAETPQGIVRMGDWRADEATRVRLNARALAPAGSRLVLKGNGRPLAESTGLSLEVDAEVRAAEHASFRVEVEWPQVSPAPWMVSNAIAFGPAGTPRRPVGERGAPTEASRLDPGLPLTNWRVEKDPATTVTAVPDSTGQGLVFAFALAKSGRATWAAVAAPVPRPLRPDDAISFAASAEGPMRLSVQARAPDGPDGQRWSRSIYLDGRRREFTLRLSDFTPVAGRPVGVRLSQSDTVLFVVDRTHARAGATGRVVVEQVRLAGPRAR